MGSIGRSSRGSARSSATTGATPTPSCTQEGAVNSAGAGGPMQFLASTWAQYGVDAEGDGPPDRWNPADAIFGAANYLRASGAPGSYREAIFAYNHAGWYVEEVERWAAKYSAPVPVGRRCTRRYRRKRAEVRRRRASTGADTRLASETATPVRFIPGERALLAPGDGHVALVPAGVPATVQAMVVAGNELQDLPYGPDGHPDPLGAPEEDCSSTVNYVLYRAGVRPLAEIVSDNPLAQDYVSWGAPGPGAVGDDLRDRHPDPPRLHRDRGPAPGHESQRHRRRPQPRRRRPALADPRPHPDVGALVGAPPAGVVRWRADGRAQGRLPADRRRAGERQLRALAARGRRRGVGAGGGSRARPAVQPPRLLEGLPARRGGAQEAFFRPQEWWEEQDDRAAHAHERHRARPGARTAKLSTKEELEFGQALLATGANVRRLNVPGCELEQHPLPAHARQRRCDPRGCGGRRGGGADRRLLHRLRGRRLADADRQALHDRDAGAAHARTRLRRSAAGRFFQELLEAHGVTVHGGDELERFEGDGRVAKVVTKSGLELPADAVVIGAGVDPRRAARAAARASRSASAVACAAPRASRAPRPACSRRATSASTTPSLHGGPLRIEHWDVAFNHGKTAALNMLGRDVPHETVPYFYLRARRLGRTRVRRPGA